MSSRGTGEFLEPLEPHLPVSYYCVVLSFYSLLLFVDEADAFLRKRATVSTFSAVVICACCS